MKLTEFLKTVASDEYVYLGPAWGFLWIGYPAEIVAKLPELDEDYVKRIKTNIRRNERFISYREKQLQTANTEEKKGIERELKRLRTRKSHLERWLESRVPFGEREVKDVYHKYIVEPAGTVVIIEGEEFGDYWTLDEILNEGGIREKV